jgi:Ca2+-binding EF-hand superfamily protein
LIAGLKATKGLDFNEKEIDEMIKKVDADGSGDINYSEFITTAVSLD